MPCRQEKGRGGRGEGGGRSPAAMDDGSRFGKMTLSKEPIASVRAKQQWVKEVWQPGGGKRFVHMVPKGALLTSVAIPLALTAVALAGLGRGFYNMSMGLGKLDD